MLRGFALLGILLVNVELMRGPGLYPTIAGLPGELPTGLDRVVDVAVGWLASGTFLSSFAMLFGLGAAVVAGRVRARGGDPRRVLARRYLVLGGFGLAHMVLLFPGDILFAYGLAGLVLLAFVNLPTRDVAWWGVGTVGVLALLTAVVGALGLMSPTAEDAAFGSGFARYVAERADVAVAARTGDSYLDVIGVNAWEALFVQGSQLIVIPWVIALFLLGFSVGRTGLLHDLRARRPLLRRVALVAVPLGLILNVPLGMTGTLAVGTAGQPWDGLALVSQVVGAPVLAVGYLATLALLCSRFGVPGPLAAVGRMALTGYLLQSVLAALVFAGFGWYGRFGAPQALGVVVGIWAVLLLVCPLWLRRFRFGPVEWCWRWATYGTRPSLRR